MAHVDPKDAQGSGPLRTGAGSDPSSPRSRGWLGLGLLCALQLVLLWPFRHYVTDDTYIHLQFARNLAQGDGFSFFPGEPVYGFTSPLWVLLLAAAFRLGVDGLVFAKGVGLLATLGSVVAVHQLARIWISDRVLVWAATLAWAVDAWLLRWTLSGMETSLGVGLVSWGFVAHARTRQTGGSWIPSMTLFALAGWVRPECVGLCLVAWFDAVLPGRRAVGDGPGGAPRDGRGTVRGSSWVRRGVEAAFPLVVLLLPWLLYASVTFGRILPSSIAAKSPGLVPNYELLIEATTRVLTLLGATRGIELLLLGLATSLLLARLVRGRVERDTLVMGFVRYRLAVAWLLLLGLAFAVRESVLVSRYLLPATPMTTVLAWAGFGWVLGEWRRFPGGSGRGAGPGSRSRILGPSARRTLAALALGCVLGLNAWVLLGRALPHARQFPIGLEASLGSIADWLRENTEPGVVVGSPDIGVLGYRSERRILDLSGLVSPELIPLYEGRCIEDFIVELGFSPRYRPDYLVDREIEVDRLPLRGPHGERLELLMVKPIGPLGLGRRGAYHYSVYRVDWSDVPPTGP